jgi:myo-inositol-1(or 4)-monophosphatase
LQDLENLKRAAVKAGKIALGYFDKHYQTWEKEAGAGPVTEADLEIDDFLKTFLLNCEPQYGWLSEETEDGSSRLTKSKVFIVDPIDGTRSFIAGDETWAHSLAVVENGIPIAAVVYLPKMDLLYTAEAGKGAFLNDNKIFVSQKHELKDAEILSKKSILKENIWKNDNPDLFKQRFLPSLAYRLALVAEGKFDAMIALGRSWEWDICAGHLLVSEAGGNITTSYGDQIEYNSESGSSKGIIAGNPHIHTRVSNELDIQHLNI